MSPDDPRHGERRGYRAHREDGEEPCSPCLRANARYKKQITFDHHRGLARRRSTVGVVRRIRALQRLGWSLGAIGAEMGVSRERVRKLAVRAPDFITPAAFDRVDAAYNRLSMTPPPPSRFASNTRNYAAKQGWPPPLAWDDIDFDARPANTWEEPRGHYEVDHAVVWRVLDGDVIDTTYAERIEIMRQWLARGGSERDLARRMGWRDGRYVTRKDVA